MYWICWSLYGMMQQKFQLYLLREAVNERSA